MACSVWPVAVAVPLWLVDAGSSSTGSRTNTGGIASQSWGQLASRASNAIKGNSNAKQLPTTSLDAELPYTDDDSSSVLVSSNPARSGNTASTGTSGLSHMTGQHQQTGALGTGVAQGTGVGRGGQVEEEASLSQRDPTNPSSVVGAHSAWMAEPHSAVPRDGLGSNANAGAATDFITSHYITLHHSTSHWTYDRMAFCATAPIVTITAVYSLRTRFLSSTTSSVSS